jgi:hypothetical protein
MVENVKFNAGLRIKIPQMKEKPTNPSNFIDYCSEQRINELYDELEKRGLTNWRVLKSNKQRPGECYFYNTITRVNQFEFPTENLPTVTKSSTATRAPTVTTVPEATCGLWGCFGRGGSKQTKRNKKRKSKTIKRRK